MIVVFRSPYCNYGAVSNMLERMGMKYIVSSSISDFTNEIRLLILPGVSAFDPYIKYLKDTEFFDKILLRIKNNGLKVVGICSGAQVMFESSDEGNEKGLGILEGRVIKIRTNSDIPLPHIGWNTVKHLKTPPKLLKTTSNYYYFCHSFRFPNNKNAVAFTNYGEKIPVIVKKGSLTALQFHPEKSYIQGMQLFKWAIN